MKMILFSFMNLTGILSSYHLALRQQKHFSWLISKLPAILILSLCGLMLWQCSACLLKYLSRPTGPQVDFVQSMEQSPFAITVCNIAPEQKFAYTFPELHGLDVQKQPYGDWHPLIEHEPVTQTTFVSITHQFNLRLCKTINLPDGALFAVRMCYYCFKIFPQLNRMEVYLHRPGQFHYYDFSTVVPVKMLSTDENLTLQVNLETMKSLPSENFDCRNEDLSQTLDNCVLSEAFRAANNSAGCISNRVRYTQP
jgi:hypothetical protein